MHQELIETIDILSRLEIGWNGCGSIPIYPEVIETAKKYAMKFAEKPHISPTNRGTIQFDFITDGKEIEVEIFRDKVEFLTTTSQVYTAEEFNTLL